MKLKNNTTPFIFLLPNLSTKTNISKCNKKAKSKRLPPDLFDSDGEEQDPL